MRFGALSSVSIYVLPTNFSIDLVDSFPPHCAAIIVRHWYELEVTIGNPGDFERRH